MYLLREVYGTPVQKIQVTARQSIGLSSKSLIELLKNVFVKARLFKIESNERTIRNVLGVGSV